MNGKMRLRFWPRKNAALRQPTDPVVQDEAEALRGEIRALSAAIEHLAEKVERPNAPVEPPTLRAYANENTDEITPLALVVAVAFGIASSMNGASADLREVGCWLLLTTATALMIGLELVGAGLRALSAAWDAAADQGLERRSKIVTIAAAVRLTLFVTG